MIKNILDTVLKIEDDSKAKVAEAQQKAREIKETAERENVERLNTARSEAASALLASINRAKKEWEDNYKQRLASQDKMYSDFLESKNQEISRTAEKILSIIINPRHKNLNE